MCQLDKYSAINRRIPSFELVLSFPVRIPLLQVPEVREHDGKGRWMVVVISQRGCQET